MRDLSKNMSINKTDTKRGFSLVEVLIFVTIFSIFFVLAASVVTTTLRMTKENQNRIRASHYAEDLKEWFEAERAINWGGASCGDPCSLPANPSFTELVTQADPASFCFNDKTITGWPTIGAGGCLLDLDGQFRRIATFSAQSTAGYVNQVGVDITVEWKDGTEMHSVPLRTAFSIWE